jgi:hypothetical protein
VAIGREARRLVRRPAVAKVFDESTLDVALDLLEIVELAWHDVYGEISPPDEVVDDVLLMSDGHVHGLVSASRLALTDWRDLRVAASAKRAAT